MTIYKSQKGKEEILALYDKQLERLKVPYSDKWISTSFGITHLIETGNLTGIPLLVFHGGNATTAYTLLLWRFIWSRNSGKNNVCCTRENQAGSIVCSIRY